MVRSWIKQNGESSNLVIKMKLFPSNHPESFRIRSSELDYNKWNWIFKLSTFWNRNHFYNWNLWEQKFILKRKELSLTGSTSGFRFNKVKVSNSSKSCLKWTVHVRDEYVFISLNLKPEILKFYFRLFVLCLDIFVDNYLKIW